MSGWRNGAAGWGRGARWLHWAVAGVILFQLGLGLWMVYLTLDLAERFALVQVHKSWGTVAFALIVARIAWRGLAGPRPAPVGPVWQRRVAAGTHGLLYALMVVMPVSGWVAASASPLQDLLGMQNMVLGLFALPDPWVPGNEGLSDAAGWVHGIAAFLLMALVALHVAAALWHQVVKRDHLIGRMWHG